MSRKRGNSEEVKGERSRAKGNGKPAQTDASGEIEGQSERHPSEKAVEETHSAINPSADGPQSKIQNKSDPDSYRDENPTSKIKEPLTTHNSPLTTMEVHHHPEIEKKGIKEYLLEGLMIFIAVMMGFFAESLREHINEQRQVKDYAANLYSDMKADTLELHNYLTYFKFANSNADTLMQLLTNNDPKQIPAGELYYFGLFGGAYHIFTPHDATLLTMKSSGALRFFGDKSISRKLAVYDELCQNMKLSEEKDNGIYVETRKARAKIFEYKYNEIANDIYHGLAGPGSTNTDPYGVKIASRWAKVDSFKKTNPPLLSYDKTLFNEYVEMVRSRFLGLKVGSADTLLHHSSELVKLLKEKYELKDE